MKAQITYKTLVSQNATKEVDLPETPFFIQEWNYRTVIGFYPKPYYFPSGKGFVYHVFIARNSVGSPTELVTFEIPDWSIKTVNTNNREADMRNYFIDMLLEKDNFNQISEDTFKHHYMNVRQKFEVIQ